MTAMTPIEAATTTSGDSGASRTTYCPDVAALDDPDIAIFDFLSPVYIRAVQQLPAVSAVKWRKGASLTALSYDRYGTESHWATILLYNGFLSSSHIPPGATVNIPEVSGLKAKLTVTKKGTVVKV